MTLSVRDEVTKDSGRQAVETFLRVEKFVTLFHSPHPLFF
jgi:hypothetical protein